MFNKKMKIKLVVLLLISVLMVAIFSGCGIDEIFTEPKEDSLRRQERLLYLLEEKYGVKFEVVSLRSNGSFRSTNSYNVKSEEYPNVRASASLRNEYQKDEEMNESYGSKVYKWQSNEYLREYFTDKDDDNIVFITGVIAIKDQSIFRESKVDLKKYSFENIFSNHKEMLDYSAVYLMYFLNENTGEVNENLLKRLYEYALSSKEWGVKEMKVEIFEYNTSIMRSEYYDADKKYDSDFGGKLSSDLRGTGNQKYFFRLTTINLDKINSFEDLKNSIEMKKTGSD